MGRDDIEGVLGDLDCEIELPSGDEALLNVSQLPGESITQDDIDKLFA